MNKGYRILIIDDDPVIREDMRKAFASQFDVAVAGSGKEGLALAQELQPDLIIVDMQMPVMDGIMVCKHLRAADGMKNTPIIMFTAADDDELRSQAFFAGADEVLSKPFRPKEFVARVVTKIKQLKYQPRPASTLTCGNLTLDLNKLTAKVGKKAVKLTALEFALLTYLVRSKDQVLSRENMLDQVWKQRGVTDRAVDSSISALRKKLAGFDHEISAVYGVGYSVKAKGRGPHAKR